MNQIPICYYCFTPPAVRPEKNRFWQKRKTRIRGMLARMLAAIISFQLIIVSSIICPSPTDTVFISSVVVRTIANWNSFQLLMNA